MQVQACFPQGVSGEEMVQHADVVSSLASIDCLINKVIYLLNIVFLNAQCIIFLIKTHLTWYGLTAHTKDGTFCRRQEVHGPRLPRI